MSEIRFFEHEEFGKIRLTDKDGAPWFIARDVAIALGYKDINKAVNKHCKKIAKFMAPNTINPYNIIPESDVYRMALMSELPAAEKFKDWVVEVVIPTIRRTGAYSMVAHTQEPSEGTHNVVAVSKHPSDGRLSIEYVANEFSAAKRLALDMNLVGSDAVIAANQIVLKITGVDALKLAEYKPVAEMEYVNATLLGKKYLGGLSPHKVNILLAKKGFQVRRGGKWYPTREGAKYTVYSTTESKNGEAYSKHRSWSLSVVDLIRPEVVV